MGRTEILNRTTKFKQKTILNRTNQRSPTPMLDKTPILCSNPVLGEVENDHVVRVTHLNCR